MDLARARHGEKDLACNCRGKVGIWREEEALHTKYWGGRREGAADLFGPRKRVAWRHIRRMRVYNGCNIPASFVSIGSCQVSR
jgi:hypothetical protein